MLLKLLTIVGGPQVLSALIPLAQAEGHTESKAKSSILSAKWFVTLASNLLSGHTSLTDLCIVGKLTR